METKAVSVCSKNAFVSNAFNFPCVTTFSESNRVELLKQKPTKRPNWVDLMSEIEEFKYGFGGRLKKTTCNDRSGPILSTTKVGDNVRDSTQ